MFFYQCDAGGSIKELLILPVGNPFGLYAVRSANRDFVWGGTFKFVEGKVAAVDLYGGTWSQTAEVAAIERLLNAARFTLLERSVAEMALQQENGEACPTE